MPDENTPPQGFYPKSPFTPTPGGPAVTPEDAAAIVAAFDAGGVPPKYEWTTSGELVAGNPVWRPCG